MSHTHRGTEGGLNRLGRIGTVLCCNQNLFISRCEYSLGALSASYAPGPGTSTAVEGTNGVDPVNCGARRGALDSKQ